MPRLQNIYLSPLTETASLTQVILLVMGLFFSSHKPFFPPAFLFFVSDFQQAFLLSVFLKDVSFFLQKEDVSGSLIYLFFFHTFSLSTFATLFLFLIHISLWILPSTPDFNSLSNQQTESCFWFLTVLSLLLHNFSSAAISFHYTLRGGLEIWERPLHPL